jgi:hypothetical protein
MNPRMKMKTPPPRGAMFGCAALILAGTAAWLGSRFAVTPPSAVVAEVLQPAAQPQAEQKASNERVVTQPFHSLSEPAPLETAAQTSPISVVSEPEATIPEPLADFIEQVNRGGRLPPEAITAFRQISHDSLRAARELARAARTVQLSSMTSPRIRQPPPNSAPKSLTPCHLTFRVAVLMC